MIAWLRAHVSWFALAAAVVLGTLWLLAASARDEARRERDAEAARADAATQGAQRERQVFDDMLAATAEHERETATIEATRVESGARRTAARVRLSSSVDTTGSTADEANRRIEARERAHTEPAPGGSPATEE